MVGIGQDRIVSLYKLRDQAGARHILKRNRPQLNLARTKLIVSSLQLDELLAARASGLPLKKDEHYVLSARIAQAQHLAVLALQAEIGRGPHRRGGRRQR